MPRPFLTLCACLLSGCAASTFADPVLPPQASLMQPCAAPVPLPDRALSDQEIEVLWGRDRSALRDCAARQAALTAATNPD